MPAGQEVTDSILYARPLLLYQSDRTYLGFVCFKLCVHVLVKDSQLHLFCSANQCTILTNSINSACCSASLVDLPRTLYHYSPIKHTTHSTYQIHLILTNTPLHPRAGLLRPTKQLTILGSYAAMHQQLYSAIKCILTWLLFDLLFLLSNI